MSTEASWSVVEYHEVFIDGVRVAHPEIRVLATSGPGTAPDAISPGPSGVPIAQEAQLAVDWSFAKRRVEFQIGSAQACVRAELSLAKPPAVVPPPIRRAAFFRVTADAEGRILAVEPLYSEMPDRNAALAAFLRSSAHLDVSGAGSVQAFLVLMLGPDGEIGHIIAGATHIESPWFSPARHITPQE